MSGERMIDLHVHPSLKMYYLPYLKPSFHARVYAGKHWNPLSFRTQYRNLARSPMKVLLCAHYVIEQGFVRQGIRPWARAMSWSAAPTFYGRLRRADPFETLKAMMDTLEEAVPATNARVPAEGRRLRMVGSYAELATLAESEIALIHAIEGSHALGYAPGPDETREVFWEKVQDRLEYLRRRGVCLVTISHFWDNPFGPQTNGTEIVPRKRRGGVVGEPDDAVFHMRRADWRWDDPEHLAEPFARSLLEHGMLIDVAHTQEHGRQAIYDLCSEYERPVVASHVGLQHFFEHEYNIADHEIDRIRELGGVIGLILSRRWLVDPVDRYRTGGDGVEDLIASMRYIRRRVGDVSCIGIGTDFDGLTDPFRDCHVPQHLSRIADRMREDFTTDEIDQILYGNAQRVLERGWVEPLTDEERAEHRGITTRSRGHA